MKINSNDLKLPFYAKLSLTLISLCILTIALYFGKQIILPILLSLLFAILLRPVVIFLNTKLKFPHVIAALTAVTFFVIFVSAVILFISWQVSDITHDWNKIKHNFAIHYEHLQHWVKQRYHLSYSKQKLYIENITNESLNENSKLVGSTLNSFTNTVVNAILIPIYVFLILLYRNLFIQFLSKIVKTENEKKLHEILYQIKTVVQSYIVGLLIEMAVIVVLTIGGLLLLGVEYAILLGIITAILNLIPYIGILIAAAVTVLATLVNSSDPTIIVGVIVLNVIVQFIDNNIIVPKIIGNKVRINALVSMVGVVIGGAIAGISGMFLAIPFIAIIKVVFDRIEILSPWGHLLGDDLPKTYEWNKILIPDFTQGNSKKKAKQETTKN